MTATFARLSEPIAHPIDHLYYIIRRSSPAPRVCSSSRRLGCFARFYC